MPETFENVSIIKKANVYFGGQVTSRTVQFADGSKKTLGFMQAGDYDFGTEAAELMAEGDSLQSKNPPFPRVLHRLLHTAGPMSSVLYQTAGKHSPRSQPDHCPHVRPWVKGRRV